MNTVSQIKYIKTPLDDIISLLNLFKTRLQWSSGKEIISKLGITPSRGWDETIKNLKKGGTHEYTLTKARDDLVHIAKIHTYVGNKRISLFDLREQSNEDREKILTWAENELIKQCQKYCSEPFSITDTPTDSAELEEYKEKPPQLISIEKISDKIYLQFLTTRSFSERSSINKTELSKNFNTDYFDKYQEIIGVKTQWMPCFDSIIIDPKNAIIEIRLDCFHDLQSDDRSYGFIEVINAFNKIAKPSLKTTAINVGIINLYPAINPLYTDENCGIVTALGFIATSAKTSSNNHGRIHRKKSQDIRKDSFHAGGKSQVEKIEPYAIGVTWQQNKPKSDISIEIIGSVRDVYAGRNGQITTAQIMSCIDHTDYDFILDQLLTRLPRKKL